MSTTVPVPAVGDVADRFQSPARLFRAYAAQLSNELRLDRLLRLGLITVEFALIVIAIRVTNIETPSFELVVTLALGGFLVHHFLPAAWRQNFFAILSVASVLLVLGWEHGAWLLALGGILIGICHVPLPVWARVILLLGIAALLAMLRNQLMPWSSTIPTTIWPLLGSMFMFRLIVYLYDLKHGAGPFSIGRALSYFFMLPNVCFPLFPVVDYKTLQRSAYNDDALHLYHTGAKWMMRGLIHLTLYKIVYFAGVIEPSEAVNGTGAARYMVATFLLYLKISGLFHIIVGLLHMYGYGLAETHHLYLFSSSFTDFWRRINIYWKDFIQKLVFNPAYFLLRRAGEIWAVAIATLVAFTATWFFHSYQWFWIRGEFPIVWSDLVFWFGLGIVVMVNVLLETRRGRQRSLKTRARPLQEDLSLAVKIAATFAAICILWTIWSTPDLADIGFILRALLNSGPLDMAVLLGVPLSVGVLGVIFGSRRREVFGTGTQASINTTVLCRQALVVCGLSAIYILLFLRPVLLEPLSPRLATVVKDIRYQVQLNRTDAKRLQRGYYEDLGDVTRFNSELWTMYGGRPPGWDAVPMGRARADGIEAEFIPSTARVSKGVMTTINSFGMRDREYTAQPGPNTFRIGLVGASHDMGMGVGDDKTYENLVEDQLNREIGQKTGRKFEILNFSHSYYSPTQKLSVIEQRIHQFRPQIILYVANRSEIDWTFKSLGHIVKFKLLDQYPFLRETIEKAGIPDIQAEFKASGPTSRWFSNPFQIKKFETEQAQNRPQSRLPADLQAKLAPFAEETLKAVLERFRNGAESKGIKPVMVLLEIPSDGPSNAKSFNQLKEIGGAVGLPILSLQGSFSSISDRTSLWIAPWDDHTNEKGHRLLADRLYSLLLKNKLIPTQAEPDAQNSRPEKAQQLSPSLR